MPPPRLAGMRVLVVEDDVDTRETVLEMLKGAGASVKAVGTVAAALDAARAERFDAILTDYLLPGGQSGYDLVKQIRIQPVDADVPVLGYTALTAAVVPALEQAAFTLFLTKPGLLLHLVDTLRRLRG